MLVATAAGCGVIRGQNLFSTALTGLIGF